MKVNKTHLNLNVAAEVVYVDDMVVYYDKECTIPVTNTKELEKLFLDRCVVSVDKKYYAVTEFTGTFIVYNGTAKAGPKPVESDGIDTMPNQPVQPGMPNVDIPNDEDGDDGPILDSGE